MGPPWLAAWLAGLDPAGTAWVVEEACRAAGVPIPAGSPPGVEIVCRTDRSTTWLFAINHSAVAAAVPLDRPGVDVLASNTYGHVLEQRQQEMARGMVAVLGG